MDPTASPAPAGAPAPPGLSFETHPSRYRHWRLTVDGPIAELAMNVQEDAPLRPGYPLKLNSYDLGVDIELCDAIERLRFEQPAVRALVVTSLRDRVFCAGANIFMLASSTHSFKVNFCKYTNETRLSLEDASAGSGLRTLAAINGPCAGGGYELALACDEILLVDDGSSAVSLPEVPLLGVLPGTGGLTRLVDKRRVRRDRADLFCTLAEGVKGRRAVDWGLVDRLAPRSRFAEQVGERARALAAQAPAAGGSAPLALEPLEPEVAPDRVRYRGVELTLDRARRVAQLRVSAPADGRPESALRLWRELDDALLRLRFEHDEIGVVLLRTRGDLAAALAADRALAAAAQGGDRAAREVVLKIARVLRRLDATAKSFFAVADEGSCFGGALLELALAADRLYALDDPARPVALACSPLNAGVLPMGSGRSRLASRFLGDPARVEALLAQAGPLDAEAADRAGLVTVRADEIDFDEELRVAVEERASLSPDALTGMEASLRFCGPESTETKIFGRLSAWQNWIFQRPNAVGPQGALSLYGKPDRPRFDYRRT